MSLAFIKRWENTLGAEQVDFYRRPLKASDHFRLFLVWYLADIEWAWMQMDCVVSVLFFAFRNNAIYVQ